MQIKITGHPLSQSRLAKMKSDRTEERQGRKRQVLAGGGGSQTEQGGHRGPNLPRSSWRRRRWPSGKAHSLGLPRWPERRTSGLCFHLPTRQAQNPSDSREKEVQRRDGGLPTGSPSWARCPRAFELASGLLRASDEGLFTAACPRLRHISLSGVTSFSKIHVT